MNYSCRFTFEGVKEIADFLLSKAGITPTIGIICGSGLGGLTDLVEIKYAIDYKNVPGFPMSTGGFLPFYLFFLI